MQMKIINRSRSCQSHAAIIVKKPESDVSQGHHAWYFWIKLIQSALIHVITGWSRALIHVIAGRSCYIQLAADRLVASNVSWLLKNCNQTAGVVHLTVPDSSELRTIHSTEFCHHCFGWSLWKKRSNESATELVADEMMMMTCPVVHACDWKLHAKNDRCVKKQMGRGCK